LELDSTCVGLKLRLALTKTAIIVLFFDNYLVSVTMEKQSIAYMLD
jgi:hypothetical protein